MYKKWSEQTTSEKTANIISWIALAAWLLFEALEKKMQYASLLSCIAMCIVCICETISFWNVKRAFSYVAIGGAVLLLTVITLQILFTI